MYDVLIREMTGHCRVDLALKRYAGIYLVLIRRRQRSRGLLYSAKPCFRPPEEKRFAHPLRSLSPIRASLAVACDGLYYGTEAMRVSTWWYFYWGNTRSRYLEEHQTARQRLGREGVGVEVRAFIFTGLTPIDGFSYPRSGVKDIKKIDA